MKGRSEELQKDGNKGSGNDCNQNSVKPHSTVTNENTPSGLSETGHTNQSSVDAEDIPGTMNDSSESLGFLTEEEALAVGLTNPAGKNNCFLNCTIQVCILTYRGLGSSVG